MNKFTYLLLCLLCCGAFSTLHAQNIAIAAQNPDGLYVCGSDEMSVTLTNTAGSVVTGVKATVVLPAGITYVVGSVQSATEANVGNPNAPVFDVADVPVGGSRTFLITVKAGCGMVQAINSGQLFSNQISSTYNGGVAQATTPLFKVETGLLITSSVVPSFLSGQQGDMLTRKITVRNTREGPISALSFTDVHSAGIDITLLDVGGTNVSALLFQANVPGSIFTTVGDGDNLLENGEELMLTEKITITKCAANVSKVLSNITVGWGCDGFVCQQDTIPAEVEIQATTANPNLVFTPKYNPPVNQCGDEPAYQEVLITNTGPAATNSVNLLLLSQDTFHLGMDGSSFEYNLNSTGWQPVSPGTGTVNQVLPSCGKTFQRVVNIVLPGLAPGESMIVRFKTYFCAAPCYDELSFISAAYSYPKSCPTNQFISGNFNFIAKPEDIYVEAKTKYDFGGCMENGGIYNLEYYIKSLRQTKDTGYLHIYFDLPWGVEWTGNCNPVLDGKSPLSVEVTSTPKVSNKVKLVYKLPFSQDSVGGEFCVLFRYTCDDLPACSSDIPNVPPRGADYIVFPPPPGCNGCDLKVTAVSGFATAPGIQRQCVVSTCDNFTLVGHIDPACPGGGGGGGNGSGGGGLDIASAAFNTFRLNVGLQDDDDDRKADSNNLTTSPKIRRDRFLVGDTMRTQLRVAVLEGNLSAVAFRLFNESWQSDFGVGGGDDYQITDGKRLFVNYDTLAFFRGTVTLKIAATGESYTCTVDTAAIRSDQHVFTIAAPNIRPLQTEDVMTSMFDQYSFTMADLAALGCVPPGLVLQKGDSLIFESDYKFEHNFVPMSDARPPLVNFRNTLCGTNTVYAWKTPGCFSPLLRQFSGYVERVRAPVLRLYPCDTADQVSPFEYDMRIARGNLFPFEVRPLTQILGFTHTLPLSTPLIEGRLKFLRMQESVLLYSNVQLVGGSAGGGITLDYTPFFNPLIDEGWAMQTDLLFGPNCDLNGNEPAFTSLTVQYPNMCFHKPITSTYSIQNPTGYVDARPKLRLIPQDSLLYLPGSALNLNFQIKNNSDNPGPNGWLVIEDAGTLTDIQLVYLPSGQPVPSIGGVYQIGDYLAFEQKNFRLDAKNLSCEVVSIRLRYGWDCSQMTNPASDVCGDLVKIIKIRPQKPELELIVQQQPADIPLCAPSEYFEFEIYNANEGTASGVLASLKLPSGLKVVPNSAQISYPTGSAWAPIADPSLVNGILQWNPEDAAAALKVDGLIGVSQAPKNSFSIRFKVEASCGFVSNSLIVYGTEAVQPCGALSNILRKPGPPVKLSGLEPSYQVQAQLGFSNPPGLAACGQAISLTATLIMGDAPLPGDSIYILLPAGTSYVAGSYLAVQNAPAGPPQVKGQTLQLPLPASAGIGAVVKFTFQVRYDDPAGCDDKIITLQTREREGAFCPSQNTNCSVYVATGESLLTLNTQNPDLLLKNFEALPAGNGFTFKALLENAGSGAAQNEVVKFYIDQNGNGKVDAGEPLVQEAKFSQLIASGNSASITGPLGNLTAADLCKLIAVISGSDNCACSDHVFPLGGSSVVTTSVASCTVIPLTIGTDPQTGHTYTWATVNGLSCTDCSTATFTPDASVTPGDVLTFVLLDKAGDCTVERRFVLQYGIPGGIETPDVTICRGESVKLVATAGGTYQWSGTGVTNPSAAEQVLNPTATATYKVTVTFPGGCTGTGQSLVTVLPVDTIKLANLKTCKGSPVDIFGTLTDVAGTYTKVLQQANGCDSVLVQRLFVSPTESSENKPLCPQDTILVFGEKVGKAGSYCKTFTSSSGCDSMHCVIVKSVPIPVLPTPDTVIIALGDTTILLAPNNLADYLWVPSTNLTCNNCPTPGAFPDSSTTFTLKVKDGNGCENGVTYRVLVFPPCFKEIHIPDAFTPNGDGVNDVFRVVPYEGFETVISLQVYDRWGNKVFESSAKNLAWDGTVDGKPAPADVYAYVIQVDCPGNERKVYQQGVTLLR